MNMSRPLKALLQSRKFWLAVIGLIGAVTLYVNGGISADALVDAIISLAALVIGGIAIEDAAAKWHSTPPGESTDGESGLE